jgi:hypothetical protein
VKQQAALFSKGNTLASSSSHETDNKGSAEPEDLYCDACEKDFPLERAYNQHMQSHVKCPEEGCVFQAVPKLVQEHQKMAHSSGLPSRWAYTSDELAQWRNERRRNYPTDSNVKQKQEIKQEKMCVGAVATDHIFRHRGKINRYDQQMHVLQPAPTPEQSQLQKYEPLLING